MVDFVGAVYVTLGPREKQTKLATAGLVLSERGFPGPMQTGFAVANETFLWHEDQGALRDYARGLY